MSHGIRCDGCKEMIDSAADHLRLVHVGYQSSPEWTVETARRVEHFHNDGCLVRWIDEGVGRVEVT